MPEWMKLPALVAAVFVLIGLYCVVVFRYESTRNPHCRVELLSEGKVRRQWESTRRPRPVGEGSFNAATGYTFTDAATGESVTLRADGGVIVITELEK